MFVHTNGTVPSQFSFFFQQQTLYVLHMSCLQRVEGILHRLLSMLEVDEMCAVVGSLFALAF